MAYQNFREILISYANTRGGGLPLSAEEICNATVLYVQEELDRNLERTTSLVEDYISAFRAEYQQAIAQAQQNLNNQVLLIKSDIENYVQEQKTELYGYIEEKKGELEVDVKNEILYGDVIEGSETIVVDVNEDNTALEIHLDAEVVSKIERSVLIPLQTSTNARLPVLGTDNSIGWEPVESFVGGGGGTKLYKHSIYQEEPYGPFVNSFAISTRSTPYTTMTEVANDFNNGNILSLVLDGYRAIAVYGLTAIFWDQTSLGEFTLFGVPLQSDTVTEL